MKAGWKRTVILLSLYRSKNKFLKFLLLLFVVTDIIIIILYFYISYFLMHATCSAYLILLTIKAIIIFDEK
jgi:hypothetical protein